MKKILIVAFAIGLLTSCSDDNSGVFEKSADQRMLDNKVEFFNYLNNDNWVIELFPEVYEEAGGYAIYVDFKDNFKADITSDLVTWRSKYAQENTSYDVFNRLGTVLSFNEYNNGLHVLAKPSRTRPKGGLKTTMDYEFVYQKREGDIIYTKGMKTRHIIRFVKTEKTAEEYMNDVAIVKNFVSSKDRLPVEFNVDGDIFEFAMARTELSRVLSYIDKKDELHKTAFVYTDKGIRFFEPFMLNGVEVFELILDETNNVLQSKDGKVKIKMIKSSFDFNSELWAITINDTDVSPTVKQKYEEVKKTNTDILSENLSNVIKIGTFVYEFELFGREIKLKQTGLHFASNDFASVYNTLFRVYEKEGDLYVDVPIIGGGFGWKTKNVKTDYTHLKPFVDLVSDNSSYKIEVLEKDWEDKATKMKLSSITNPDVWFILNKE